MLFSNIDKDRELSLYMIECMNKPFQWGVHDCCIFVAGWLLLYTGKDLLPKPVPWDSAKSAYKYIKENYNTLEEYFDIHFDRIPPELAVDGDITVYEKSAFIFSGNYIVSVGYHGLDMLSRTRANKAWQVKRQKD